MFIQLLPRANHVGDYTVMSCKLSVVDLHVQGNALTQGCGTTRACRASLFRHTPALLSPT